MGWPSARAMGCAMALATGSPMIEVMGLFSSMQIYHPVSSIHPLTSYQNMVCQYLKYCLPVSQILFASISNMVCQYLKYCLPASQIWFARSIGNLKSGPKRAPKTISKGINMVRRSSFSYPGIGE
jgi:hypothetical protein